jgi:Family of unknown function (DUF5677)
MGSEVSVSLHPAIQATRPPAPTASGLSPYSHHLPYPGHARKPDPNSSRVVYNTRNAPFVEAFFPLAATIKRVFDREQRVETRWDQFVSLLGRLVVEDFFEILLLAANGYGTGAQKLLRSMYELATTARFLDTHPDKLDDFIDYHWVASRKLGNAVESTFGAEFIPTEWREEVDRNYQAVKARFETTDCSKCGTRTTAISWSKTDFVTMTKSADRLKALLVPAYYMPLQHTHPNLSVLQPFLDLERKTLTFNGGPTRDLADASAKAAHAIVVDTLTLVVDHFILDDVREDIARCEAEIPAAWPIASSAGKKRDEASTAQSCISAANTRSHG